MSCRIPLSTVIATLRESGGPETIGWRMGLLRELCRAVELAHASGLSHPDLTAASVVIDGDSHVHVDGWRRGASPEQRETDRTMLGAIAHQVLTLSG